MPEAAINKLWVFLMLSLLAPEACSKLRIFLMLWLLIHEVAVNKLWVFLVLWLLTPDACSKQTMGFSHVVTTDGHTCNKQSMGFSHVVTTDGHTCSKLWVFSHVLTNSWSLQQTMAVFFVLWLPPKVFNPTILSFLLKIQESEAIVMDENSTEPGHIITTTIGGHNGEPKQVCLFPGQKGTKLWIHDSM